jgi:hypothetical protein
MTNLLITYIFLSCLCPLNKLLSITLSMTIPWLLWKSVPVIVSGTHLLRSQQERYCIWCYTCMQSIKVLFHCQSLLLFSIVHYARTLFTGCKRTWIGDQLLPHRQRYGIQRHSCMWPLQWFSICYCSIFYNGVGRFLRSCCSIWWKVNTNR